MAQEILRYIEIVEAAKQRARDAARDVADEIDFRELADDPESNLAEIVALVLAAIDDDLDQIASDLQAALAQLDLESPDLVDLDAIVSEAKSSAEVSISTAVESWLARLEQQIDDLSPGSEDIALGAGSAFASAAIATLASILEDQAEGAVNRVTSDVVDEITVAAVEAGKLLKWVTVQDKRRCDGDYEEACAPRHGDVKTLAEWETLGLPKAAHLLCCAYNPGRFPCRCLLVGADYKVGDQPVEAGEVIARARAK